MSLQKQDFSSRQQEANRQVIACLMVIGLAGCLIALAFAFVAGPLVKPMYYVVATWIAPTSTPTPHPFRATATTGPTTTALPGYISHRIGVRIIDGNGEFFDRLTGEKFIPRGYNYVRLSPINGTTGQLWEETLNPGFYDPVLAEEALEQMHADGYNVVRVAVDCCRPGSNVGSSKGGISSAYIDDVVDFLNKAKANDIYVILPLNLTPADGDYNRFWNQDPKIFAAANLRYLTLGGHQSKRLFDQDFIRALIDRNAPLDTILAYDLSDGVGYDLDWPPLTLNSGRVYTVNGKSYDMAKPDDKQKMMNDNLVYWIDQQRAAILEVDPTALVTVSFNAYHINYDHHFIEAAVWESAADFIDINMFVGAGFSLEDYVNRDAVIGMAEKPLIIGKFAASKRGLLTAASAARALRNWQVASCRYGFDGWILYLQGSEELTNLWNGMTDGGVVNDMMAPANRPDPCKR